MLVYFLSVRKPELLCYSCNQLKTQSQDTTNAQSIISSLEEIPAIPQKIVQRILAGNFVDIVELHPDSWRMEELLILKGH